MTVKGATVLWGSASLFHKCGRFRPLLVFFYLFTPQEKKWGPFALALHPVHPRTYFLIISSILWGATVGCSGGALGATVVQQKTVFERCTPRFFKCWSNLFGDWCTGALLQRGQNIFRRHLGAAEDSLVGDRRQSPLSSARAAVCRLPGVIRQGRLGAGRVPVPILKSIIDRTVTDSQRDEFRPAIGGHLC
jgi:hypothetical protein